MRGRQVHSAGRSEGGEPEAPSCLEVGGCAPQPSVLGCDLGSATLSRNVRPAGGTWGSDAAPSEGSVWSVINQINRGWRSQVKGASACRRWRSFGRASGCCLCLPPFATQQSRRDGCEKLAK